RRPGGCASEATWTTRRYAQACKQPSSNSYKRALSTSPSDRQSTVSLVKELNLDALPFLFPSYSALDAVEAGDPGKRIFQLIEQKGVIPIAWGENGFRELTNSKRPIRRPEDLHGLNIRVVGIPIFIEIFRTLGANPVGMNFNEALEAFRLGKVDAQEN